MRKRKYKIAMFLAMYDRESQQRIIEELSKQLGIKEQMFSLYVNVDARNDKFNLSPAKAQIIADYFKVDLKDILTPLSNEAQTN